MADSSTSTTKPRATRATTNTTTNTENASRCLEGAEALRFPSLQAFYEKTRWRAPFWFAYTTAAIFASLFILVPVFLGCIAGAMLMCFRGKYLLNLLDNAMQWVLTQTSSRGLAESVVTKVVSMEKLSHIKETMSCPESDSMLCHLCSTLHVELLGFILVLFFVLLMVIKVPKWLPFARVFQPWFDVFDFQFHIDQSEFKHALDSKRPLLFVVIPHGIVPIGCFMAISYIFSYLPAVTGTTFVASVVLRLPIIRQLLQLVGAQPADRPVVKNVLSKGQHGYIVSGGIAELFMSDRKRERIFLKQRKGFVKIAKETNAILVPVYLFGHTRLFDQLASGEGIAKKISRLIRGSITMFWGPFYLPIPYLTSLRVVTGPPLEIDWSDDTMSVDVVHGKFVDSVQRLYDAHKHAAGYGDTPLEIH